MKIQYQPLESVLKKSSGAVVAEILSVSPEERETFYRTIDLTAAPLQTVFGRIEIQDILLCHYTEGLPHEREGAHISPLVSGSGVEFRVSPGDRVILLVSDEVAAPGHLQVLRIEPMGSIRAIRDYYRAMVRPIWQNRTCV